MSEHVVINPHRLTPEDVVEFFRAHIHQIVAEITRAMADTPAGMERMCAALTTYWEAGFARRSMRQMLAQAAAGTPLESELDRIGKPFRHMLRLELRSIGAGEIENTAQAIFSEAKNITIEEAASGNRAVERRERLINAIRANAVGTLV